MYHLQIYNIKSSKNSYCVSLDFCKDLWHQNISNVIFLELGDFFGEKEWKIVQIQRKMQTTIILPKTLYDKSERKKLLLVNIF
jgi:hypothetical protein